MVLGRDSDYPTSYIALGKFLQLSCASVSTSVKPWFGRIKYLESSEQCLGHVVSIS